MSEACASSFFSLTQAEYAAGEIKKKVLEGKMSAEVRVEGRTDNIAGVKIPVFNRVNVEADAENPKEQLGLAGGGRAIANCREKYSNLLQLMIKLASLQVITVVGLTCFISNVIDYFVSPQKNTFNDSI